MLVYLEALLDEVVKDEEDEEQLRGEQQIVTVLRVLQQLDDLDVLDTEMKQILWSQILFFSWKPNYLNNLYY